MSQFLCTLLSPAPPHAASVFLISFLTCRRLVFSTMSFSHLSFPQERKRNNIDPGLIPITVAI